jgi:hypothetical protein
MVDILLFSRSILFCRPRARWREDYIRPVLRFSLQEAAERLDASGCRAYRLLTFLPQSRLSDGTKAEAVIVNGDENIFSSFPRGKKQFFCGA